MGAFVRRRRPFRACGADGRPGHRRRPVVAAPAIFQMFSRAPGRHMIDDFRPLMTRQKVTTIQGYFITIGDGEGELRSRRCPAAALRARIGADGRAVLERLAAHQPRDGAVIGAMCDNLDNYAAVDVLPPFRLFPWFFVIPGALRRSRLAGPAPRRCTQTAPVATEIVELKDDPSTCVASRQRTGRGARRSR